MTRVPRPDGAKPSRRSRLPRRLALDQLILGRWRKPGLLIVDDEEDQRSIVRQLAEFEGYERIWEAADGETAIAIVYEHRPHVVVLDYRMPRMNGEAVAKCIRLLSPGTMIIAFSAVLEVAPKWADLSLEKIELNELIEALIRQRKAPGIDRRKKGETEPIGDVSP